MSPFIPTSFANKVLELPVSRPALEVKPLFCTNLQVLNDYFDWRMQFLREHPDDGGY